MRYSIIIILAFFTFEMSGQALNKYWVQFTDKKNTPYSILQPQEFLSPRSIERRKRQGISIDINDLPVNPDYVNAIKKLGGKVYLTSKWFNAVTVLVEDERAFQKIKRLPFVKKVEPTGRFKKPRPMRKKRNRDRSSKYPKINNHYGYGWNQISMLNGHLLHDMGYRGDGMMIAVLDGGFVNLDISPFFDSLRTKNNLLKSRDFVDNDNWAYEASSHGFNVASTITSNLPGMLIGTSPDATMVCLRTEEVGTELRIEEDNWIAAAEYADSLGVDVINSSLGYTNFNKPYMSYSYQDMDGNTARISQGADIAASKGILVVNSAGNSGNDSWRYVGAPADADSIMAVGGVDANERKAAFSSFGPTRDGRTKPSVSARGYKTVVGTPTYKVDSVNGTSFSAPVMAGMVASLWQAFPNKNNMEIIRAVEASGDLAYNPNNSLGHGIPNMVKAYQILSGSTSIDLNAKSKYPIVIPNPFDEVFDLLFYSKKDANININISNILGQTIADIDKKIEENKMNRIFISELTNYPAGSYFITLNVGITSYKIKVLKR